MNPSIASEGRPRRGAAAAMERMMEKFETIEVDGPVVACDGGGGVGGHPKVYLNLATHGSVECPYCSRFFVARAGHGGGTAATKT